jgi:NTP pyrophosphatase (non-canonical NTP hydrolase)
MQIRELIALQIEADDRRGFPVKFAVEPERVDQLMRDLVGLVGEVGEFADLLKKVGLTHSTPGYEGPSLTDAAPRLRSELADIAIYLFRLSTILDGDLENDILQKMKINQDRYSYLER